MLEETTSTRTLVTRLSSSGQRGAFLQRVTSATAASVAAVQALRDRFAPYIAPATWDEWQRLPTTDRCYYHSLNSAAETVRFPEKLVSVFPPMDLSLPTLPFAIYQSRDDKERVVSRVQRLLSACGVPTSERLLFLTGSEQFYFAAELSELCLKLGYATHVVLSSGLGPDELQALREDLSPRHVILAQTTPPFELSRDIQTVITFNSARLFGDFGLQLDVATIDPAPLFGYRINGGSYTVSDDFHVDEIDCRIFLTTLCQELLPLVRFDTGISLE